MIKMVMMKMMNWLSWMSQCEDYLYLYLSADGLLSQVFNAYIFVSTCPDCS